jgi:hypothetical protein
MPLTPAAKGIFALKESLGVAAAFVVRKAHILLPPQAPADSFEDYPGTRPANSESDEYFVEQSVLGANPCAIARLSLMSSTDQVRDLALSSLRRLFGYVL